MDLLKELSALLLGYASKEGRGDTDFEEDSIYHLEVAAPLANALFFNWSSGMYLYWRMAIIEACKLVPERTWILLTASLRRPLRILGPP